MMIWFKKFMAQHGAIFSVVYLVSFFLLITLRQNFKFDAFFGDVFFKIGTYVVYLPFVSALATAVFFVTIYSVYRFLKN